MQKFNKAIAGGVGAACAIIVSWGIETFAGIAIPAEVGGAMTILFSAVGPMLAPANKE